MVTFWTCTISLPKTMICTMCQKKAFTASDLIVRFVAPAFWWVLLRFRRYSESFPIYKTKQNNLAYPYAYTGNFNNFHYDIFFDISHLNFCIDICFNRNHLTHTFPFPSSLLSTYLSILYKIFLFGSLL